MLFEFWGVRQTYASTGRMRIKSKTVWLEGVFQISKSMSEMTQKVEASPDKNTDMLQLTVQNPSFIILNQANPSVKILIILFYFFLAKKKSLVSRPATQWGSGTKRTNEN